MVPAGRLPGMSLFRLGGNPDANLRRLAAGQAPVCPPLPGFPPGLVPYMLGRVPWVNIDNNMRVGAAADRWDNKLSGLGKRQERLMGFDPTRYMRAWSGTTAQPVPQPPGCRQPGLFSNPLGKLSQRASLWDLFMANKRTEMQIAVIMLIILASSLIAIETFTVVRNLQHMYAEWPCRRREREKFCAWNKEHDERPRRKREREKFCAWKKERDELKTKAEDFPAEAKTSLDVSSGHISTLSLRPMFASAPSPENKFKSH